ncbi:MAG: DHH family phosphoesterase [Butyricicoccus sp.]|nr:DHH family phosphoesterase [Butyricicoccus sp.]MBQ8585778.1 DHH family phosphoesterase [Butyricicoccus sp.]
MEKRLRKILQPGHNFYFVFFLIFACICAYVSKPLAIGGVVLCGMLYFVYLGQERLRRREVDKYMKGLTISADDAVHSTIVRFPMPALVANSSTGEILWANDQFGTATGHPNAALNEKLNDLNPKFPLHWLMEGKGRYPGELRIGEELFWMFGNLVADSSGGKDSMVMLYFIPCTELIQLRESYANSRPVVGIITIDNYEEIIKVTDDAEKSKMLAEIDKRLSAWIAPAQTVLRKYDRDRYIFVADSASFDKHLNGKFTILEDVHEVQSRSGQSATLSIGIGRDGDSFEECQSFAGIAMDMALSRGGDQAVIKTKFNFEFFDGMGKEIEKRNKVKSRIVAGALIELIRDSSQVMIMGHKNSDMDAIGAAVGMACAVRAREKKVHIVVNRDRTMAQGLIEKIEALPEYEGVFISPEDAMVLCDYNTLLIVVDTNRPDYVESQPLLESINKVAVVDHHRRAASYIQNFALNLHEPYASSASELVSEMLQYMVPTSEIRKEEAECLLAGIYLDTKGFSIKAGVRAFEAAAYLRRAGAEMNEVTKLFQTTFEEHLAQSRIISQARDCGSGIVLAITEEEVDRVDAAKAADSLLRIAGVNASIVAFREAENVIVSARSTGKVNVQILMEHLGGGGNNSSAGAQMMHTSVEEAETLIAESVRLYLSDNEVAE